MAAVATRTSHDQPARPERRRDPIGPRTSGHPAENRSSALPLRPAAVTGPVPHGPTRARTPAPSAHPQLVRNTSTMTRNTLVRTAMPVLTLAIVLAGCSGNNATTSG